MVGIYDKTLTAPDNTVVISLGDAQSLLYKQLPTIIQQQVDPGQLATAITAYPEPGVDADRLASTIEGTVQGVSATGRRTSSTSSEHDEHLQQHHLRCGADLTPRRRPFRGQHHGHVGA